MDLCAVACCRHEHGRNGDDRFSDGSRRHWDHGARSRSMANYRVRLRVRHVGGNDGRHDDPVRRADGRQASAQGKPFAATGWFATGYLLTWVGFALVATAAQWALDRTALLDPKMASADQVFGGIVLIAAGIYQWTPLKDICLAHCQSPLLFIQRQGGFHRDPLGSLLLGLRHGAYCVGCCWVLMALLFVGGVMYVLWIATISAFVLVEKIMPLGRLISRIAGAGFVVAGTWLVVGL
jgi:predicted metal-binding membrane protein